MNLSAFLVEKFGVMVGQIHAFAGTTAPSGYLLCDGSAVSRTTYAELFAAIGSTFGPGDGSTTFNLPNGSGLFLQGVGSQVVGGKTFNGLTIGTRAAHTTAVNGLSCSTNCTPTVTVNNTNLAHTHSLTDFYGSGVAGNLSGIVPGEGVDGTGTSNQADNTGSALSTHTHTATYGVSHATTITSSDTETAPAALSLNFIIKT